MGSESEPEMDASEIAWRDLNLLQCAQADGVSPPSYCFFLSSSSDIGETEPYDIPYGRMYVMMARIEQLHGATQDPGIAVDDLRPESASDADEIASWVQNLLHHIHGEVCQIRLEFELGPQNLSSLQYFHDSPETYKRLIRQWIFWTASNDVPFPNLQNLPHGGVSDLKNNGRHDMLPYTQRYITMAQVERLHGNTIQDPDIVIDALRPESASDADEIALWLRNVLQLIHGEVRRIGLVLRRPIFKASFFFLTVLPPAPWDLQATHRTMDILGSSERHCLSKHERFAIQLAVCLAGHGGEMGHCVFTQDLANVKNNGYQLFNLFDENSV